MSCYVKEGIMPTLRLFWLLISRNILAGLVMGLLFGGTCGFLFSPVLLVMISIASGLQGRPAPPDLGGMGFAILFGGFFGGVFGLIAGAFFGPFLGCINGLIMSLVTRLWFMPLTDVTKYERVMRGCTTLVTIVGTLCAFAL